jgi:hypothetical protein
VKIVEEYMDGQTDLIEINSANYIGDCAIRILSYQQTI